MQLADILDSKSRFCEFKSHLVYHFAREGVMAKIVKCDGCSDEIFDGFFELSDSDYADKPEGKKQFCTLKCVVTFVSSVIIDLDDD
jgi:hypothetical protein